MDRTKIQNPEFLKDMSVSEVDEITAANARKIFKI